MKSEEYNLITSFGDKLKLIGVNVELSGNIPWIYLDKVNGVKVKGVYGASHGFTAFFSPVRKGSVLRFSDRGVVFRKIREVLENRQEG